MDHALIQHLEKRFAQSLPGVEAQIKMAPPGRHTSSPDQGSYHLACVLAFLFPKNKQWHISFIHRTSHHPNDKHAGQISFPGGKMCDLDQSLLSCALRETHEEIGVPGDHITVLGGLSPLYIPVSQFLVHPFVGYSLEYPGFQLQKEEVQQVLEVPLEQLFHPGTKKKGEIQISYGVMSGVPYYQVHQFPLWGATAMIVSELEHMMEGLFPL
ncbi:MAG: CoA pyrophosphatase [Saprospiraceae bacterium]|jgi:8-oxo-dGTP pyrophosphatase MutT (NUDIX family)|nr:CoA pyrophosphatase [Saprospiraceae bacterium]